VRTLKFAAPVALLISMLVVSACFAAPACCDPKNSSSSGGSFLPGPALNPPPAAGGCCGANRPGGSPGCAAGGQECCPRTGGQVRKPVSAVQASGKVPQGQVYETPTVVPISRITGPTQPHGSVRSDASGKDQRPGLSPRTTADRAPGSRGPGLW
jgi:hypothetical protein